MNTIYTPERLVEAMEKTLKRETEAGNLAPSGFTIAVTREAGANGALIARAIGERLSWPVYDRELLERVAEEMGLHAHALEDLDERPKGWLKECIDSLFTGTSVNEFSYLRRLLEKIVALAARGKCVIVGRGAAQALPAATTLRVRVVANLEDRIENVRRNQGLSPEDARRWVEKTDRERAQFIKCHFHMDSADSVHYDLVLNSSRFSVAECADIIIEALYRLQNHKAAAKKAEIVTAQ